MGFRVWGFWVQVLGSKVVGLGFRVKVLVLGFRVQESYGV